MTDLTAVFVYFYEVPRKQRQPARLSELHKRGVGLLAREPLAALVEADGVGGLIKGRRHSLAGKTDLVQAANCFHAAH